MKHLQIITIELAHDNRQELLQFKDSTANKLNDVIIFIRSNAHLSIKSQMWASLIWALPRVWSVWFELHRSFGVLFSVPVLKIADANFRTWWRSRWIINTILTPLSILRLPVNSRAVQRALLSCLRLLPAVALETFHTFLRHCEYQRIEINYFTSFLL